jgi:predicted permease
MDSMLRDLRFAVRGLLRVPGFTAAAVLALALGIGATTAIFSVVHAVLLRSLGWGDESRLVSLGVDFAGMRLAGFSLSVPEYQDFQSAPFLERAGAFSRGTAALQGERAERVSVAYATSTFFQVLGVQPAYGRVFAPEEDLKGRDVVALIGASAWRHRHGADPSVVGRTITLDGHPYQLIGILPDGFNYRGTYDYYLPFGFSEDQLLRQRGAHWIEGVGRLRAGLSPEAARQGLDQLSDRVQAANPGHYSREDGFRFSMTPLRDRFVASSRRPLWLLFGSVLLVLLIACGNVANLMLARSAARQREFAVRSALGAGRARMARQLLTESAALAVVGAALGVLLGAWGLDALLASAPSQVRQLADVRVDRAVLAFAVALTVATTLLFGLLPALRSSRPDLGASLKEGGQATSGLSAGRLRSLLVVAQVALSLVLLVSAGLVLRSFAGLLRVSPGFDPEGVLVARASPGGSAYDEDHGPGDAARSRYFDEALRRASALPGVQAAGGIDRLPMEGHYRLSYFIEGYEARPGEPVPSDLIRRAMPGYFHAMRQPLVAGREFSAADDARAPLVALVNEAWVRRYFPGREVVGHRIRLDSKANGQWRTIVGVVADAREEGLDRPAPPVYYFASAQYPPDQMCLVLRGAAQPSAVRQALEQIDPTQPADRIAPLEEVIASSLAPRRFPLQLLGAFAALALLLSGLGIYGVTSYGVTQRTREIGVRIAVGAQQRDVLRLVMGGALRLAALGVAIGLLSALLAAQLISSLLYGVSARDPLTYLAISLLLALVALLASFLPARRATRVDPMTALRTE